MGTATPFLLAPASPTASPLLALLSLPLALLARLTLLRLSLPWLRLAIPPAVLVTAVTSITVAVPMAITADRAQFAHKTG